MEALRLEITCVDSDQQRSGAGFARQPNMHGRRFAGEDCRGQSAATKELQKTYEFAHVVDALIQEGGRKAAFFGPIAIRELFGPLSYVPQNFRIRSSFSLLDQRESSGS